MITIHFSDMKLYVSGSLDDVGRKQKMHNSNWQQFFFVRLILGNGICDRRRSNKYRTHIQDIVASCLSSIFLVEQSH